MPRAEGFRECLIARPGKTFVISDWVAAELVSLSQVLLNLFDHSKLADALREGRDPHIEMGCLIGNVKLADFDKSNPEHKELRQLAKAANFGLPGGLGAESFIAFAKATYGVELTLQQAYDVKEAWFEQWPEMREYFKWINDQGDENNEFEILHHWSKRVRGKCRYTQACNTLFQGLASDCAKVALWNLLKTSRDPMSPLFGAQQVLFVHDEIVTECDIEDAPDALAEQEKIMIKSFAVPCPDVPVRVESKISSYYRKT
jgi:DNA polymerase-1